MIGGLQVISTPGHAPDHIAFWQPDSRALFAGDTMMHLFWSLCKPLRGFTVDMRQNMQSVRKLAMLKPEPQIILCGHGTPVNERAIAMLNRLARVQK